MVNLQTGPSDQDDISLHVNPRFDQGNIIRNSRFETSWGSEETNGGNPLTQGGSFVLTVAALLEYFKVSEGLLKIGQIKGNNKNFYVHRRFG